MKEQDYRKYQKEVDLLQHETDGERELGDAKLPWTLDWTAGTQKLQDYARVIGIAIATTGVLAASCSRLRPSPNP